MNEFQTELDIATIDFNQQLKAEVQYFLKATSLKVLFLDMFTHGMLANITAQFVSQAYNKGCLICNDEEAFRLILTPPEDLYQDIPNSDMAMNVAQFLVQRFNIDVGVSVLGMSSFPINDELLNQKIFLGYSIQGAKLSRVLECSGTKEMIDNQIINGVFGYLVMAIKKYIKK